jgi:hypothetical protein
MDCLPFGCLLTDVAEIFSVIGDWVLNKIYGIGTITSLSKGY